MAEKIRQCWAFHRDGTRCGHPAGHAGDHAVEMTWGDDECALPGEVQIPVQISAPTAPPPLVQAPVKCVACGHQHKDGTCKCGCHEFIG